MTNSDGLTAGASIWVGLWYKRHVVFDPSIQPGNPEFILLYFVQGRALCARKREYERTIVKTVHNPYDREFALTQYSKWLYANAHIAAEKKSCSNIVVENPPPPRRKCSQCDGQGTWHYTVGTFSDGAQSDGQNVNEYCSSCGGRGFIDDVIEF